MAGAASGLITGALLSFFVPFPFLAPLGAVAGAIGAWSKQNKMRIQKYCKGKFKKPQDYEACVSLGRKVLKKQKEEGMSKLQARAKKEKNK